LGREVKGRAVELFSNHFSQGSSRMMDDDDGALAKTAGLNLIVPQERI
jgi:hypothetical protein